ncbi:hypothetical protein F4782DRAFT_419124 [Xylaria castorea]|nr:hypothetical protein F4782DRAFT_419124 [Xylaria castorea]
MLNRLSNSKMEKRCYLVSRPIDNNKPSITLEWETIGNGGVVPSLLDRKPFLEHWALCVVTAREFDPASPAGRKAFRRGRYFDMGVGTSERGWLKASSNSDIHNLRNPLVWTPASIRKITCIEELGSVTCSEFMISWYKKAVLRMWGKYRPLVWNCQHFAIVLARLVVDSPNCTSKIRLLLSMRSSWLRSVRSNWLENLMVAYNTVTYIPVVGSIVVSYLAADGVGDGKVRDTWQQLASFFPELEDVTPCHW